MVMRLPNHEIVPPEPHSTGLDFRKTWTHMPRWLQIVLTIAIIIGGALALIFIKA